MKKNFLPYLVFLTGISLSGVAAYYSIIGLTAIFSGSKEPVIIMGSILEIAKLVSVSWLYNNWKDISLKVRAYFLFAILVLMLITSMGIFGFLSKAHIEQQVAMETGSASEIAILSEQIKFKEDEIEDVSKQIKVIDDSIAQMISKGQSKTALSAVDSQKKNRESLVSKRAILLDEIKPMKLKKIKSESEIKKVEAEVGPLKYLAEMYYGKTDTQVLDKTVRFVIITLIFVFDPLAVMLLLAFNITMKKRTDYTTMEYLDLSPSFRDNSKIIKPKPFRKKDANAKDKGNKNKDKNNNGVLPIHGGSF